MKKKTYDAIMLVIAVCMLVLAYLTYDATKNPTNAEPTKTTISVNVETAK